MTTQLNLRVALKDHNTWPEAHGQELRLVSIPDPAKKLAGICYIDKWQRVYQKLVTKDSIILLRDQKPEPSLGNPPLRWGAVVTLRSGKKVFCTHPELEPAGTWRGIPLGYRSPVRYHYSEITDIQTHNDITAQVA